MVSKNRANSCAYAQELRGSKKRKGDYALKIWKLRNYRKIPDFRVNPVNCFTYINYFGSSPFPMNKMIFNSSPHWFL